MLKSVYNFIRLEKWRPGAVKFLCKFIPVKKWRRALRDKYVPRDTINDLKPIFYEIKHKKQTLLASPENVHSVFLGSSHVAYGFNPTLCSAHAYNLGATSQDLATAFGILSNILPSCPNLRQVFVGIDVFSRGWSLAKASTTHFCTSYKYLYDIDYVPDNCDKELLRRCKRLDKKKKVPKHNENGYLKPTFKLPSTGFAKRIACHLREHNRNESQYVWIEKIADAISSRNGSLVVCIMPGRSDYRNALSDGTELFADLISLAQQQGITVVNFWQDPDFTDDDFCDYDHLNSHGAEKLSKKIKEYFYE